MRAPGGTKLSLIIVSWNVREHLRTCLDSLVRELDGLSYELLVVDNGSIDGTREMVLSNYPGVIFIQLDDNRGFPAANNVAIKRAAGEYILLLNPDTLVHPGSIRKCLDAFDSDVRVGMVGCKLVSADGSIQYECAANLPSLWDPLIESVYLHVLFPKSPVCGRLRMSYWDHDSECFVRRISGAFMLLRADVVRRIGPLNERIFMYYEDLDYCARIREAGYLIKYLPTATVTHFGGASSRQSESPLDDLAPVVRFTYFLDHAGIVQAQAYRFLCLFQSLVRLGISLLVAACRPIARPRGSVGKVAVHWRRLLWCFGIVSRKASVLTGRTCADSIGS